MKKIIFTFILIFIVSCAGNSEKNMPVFLKGFDLKNVTIIVENKDDKKVKIENKSDREKIIKMLVNAEYDVKLNDSGIMRKIPANDYTLYLSDDSRELKIQLWSEMSSFYTEEKWYNITKFEYESTEVIRKLF